MFGSIVTFASFTDIVGEFGSILFRVKVAVSPVWPAPSFSLATIMLFCVIVIASVYVLQFSPPSVLICLVKPVECSGHVTVTVTSVAQSLLLGVMLMLSPPGIGVVDLYVRYPVVQFA